MKINWDISPKQKEFINATADEVLFGGAAGGGKSYGQVIDAFLYAMKYPGSKQLILRRTYPELSKSIIRTVQELYPRAVFTYNKSDHVGRFKNGSLIDFSYCDREDDVYKYQSTEYDVIRFDELTHFTESMYVYLISRLRGANDFPKQIKSATNPGGVGHMWVKDRFIDIGKPNKVHKFKVDDEEATRVFIPSKVQDNTFLLKADPGYVRRLKNLSEKDQKALLHGDWNIFEGQYFTEWTPDVHVIEPFIIPPEWQKYFVLDYGLDMCAGYWVAIDDHNKMYVYKEIYQSNLIASEAAKAIKSMTIEPIDYYFAPPDLWNRRSDTGKSTADIFAENGIYLINANNNRVQGWYDMKEWLRVYPDEQEMPTASLVFFNTCLNAIRCIPSIQHDKNNPNDCAKTPHELTHAPDAIRYLCAGRPCYFADKAGDDESRYDDSYGNLVDFGSY